MDPVSDPEAGLVKHVVGTASGGGFVAALLAFFQSRERRQLGERVASLEAEVTALRDDMNAIAPRRLVGKRRKKK